MMRHSAPFLAGLLLISLAASSAAAAETRPNIVLMMGDDHGWEETGYNGHPHVSTPVLDEILYRLPLTLELVFSSRRRHTR